MTNKTIRLEHAYLPVTDIAASVAFYRVLLPDWAVRWEGKTRTGGRWLHYGDPSDLQASYLSVAEADPSSADQPLSGLRVDHIGFAHPDVGGLVRRAGEHGVRPTDYFDSEGFRRAYFVDPNGHELEFVERLSAPGQAPRGADR